MSGKLEQRLARLCREDVHTLFDGRLIGLEKESLRVNAEGRISQAPHPRALGSALTHSAITTDYSEALLEFITPPLASIDAVLSNLRDVQQFVYAELDDELLWATSMPCVVEGDASIPIAQYGSSNIGRMKTVYRQGLGYRYGRQMQVIAGVHFNYSFSEVFWKRFQAEEQNADELQDFISDRYFGILRNLKRHGWLVPYLFGASPAVCKSFLGAQPEALPAFNDNTHFQPFGTSLRLSDIGYQNSQEKETGIQANYDGLQQYTDSLEKAISTPCPEYEKIGVRSEAEPNGYRQLNANILQIENEYYSSVRPKQILEDMEKPITALRRRGVRYIELRSLDVNPLDPLGISKSQICFLEVFILFALLQDSPVISEQESREIDGNVMRVAYNGRDPELVLDIDGKQVGLRERARDIFDDLEQVADFLVRATGDDCYREAVLEQSLKIMDPDLTISAQMLAAMREHGEGFYHYSHRISREHQGWFSKLPVDERFFASMRQQATESLQRQQDLENADSLPFDAFLQAYFDSK